MINIAIDDENKITVAQQLGHHKSLQETIDKAIEMYVQYLQQKSIIEDFGTIDYAEEYDYKKQRQVL